MHAELEARGSFSALRLRLAPGEEVVADSGALAWQDPGLRCNTSTRGGLFRGLGRKVLAGESFFQNTWSGGEGGGELVLAPGTPGEILRLDLDGEILAEKGAFLAAATTIELDPAWSGLRGLFSEGIFVLRCRGTGPLFLHAWGALEELVLQDEETIVDNGQVVAWEPSLEWRLSHGGRIRNFLFSDQIVLRFSGRGRLWTQSRNPRSLANWVHPFRRVRRRRSDS